MYENSPPGSSNGEQLGTQGTASHPNADRAREHLRGAGQAAADAVRQRAENAQEWMRGRSGEAQEWARSQWGGIQHRVEQDPARATIWALGIGFVIGMLLTGLMRGGRD